MTNEDPFQQYKISIKQKVSDKKNLQIKIEIEIKRILFKINNSLDFNFTQEELEIFDDHGKVLIINNIYTIFKY